MPELAGTDRMIEIPPPMRATEGGKPFTDPEWVFEIKYDGYRVLAGVEHGQKRTRSRTLSPRTLAGVELRTKNGTDCTRWYPEVVAELAKLPGGPHVVDGEVVCLDDIGRSDFERLQARSRRRRWFPGCDAVVYAVFDLLMRDGIDVAGLPLEERKALLQELLAPAPGLLFVSYLPADAALFAQAVLPLKLEGLMAKRLGSPYVPGAVSRDWVKVKRPGWQEGRTWRN